MPPLVSPFLVNEASGDPALFVPFAYDRFAYLFDIGDISHLSPRNLLKTSHVFVTHTHMDHFVGFDSLLRILLGRDKTLHLFGPEGFLANVEGKLGGYSWNLVDNYSNPLLLNVSELTDIYLIQRTLSCQQQFRPISEDVRQINHHPVVLWENEVHKVSAAILDHGLSCLGFALEENFQINIRKDMLTHHGLAAGPWLSDLKHSIYSRKDPDTVISVPAAGTKTGKKTYRLGTLADELTITRKGQKIGYIADVAYNSSNISKIRQLAGNSDHLFIEAAFLDSDRSHAMQKKHLTARQAGEIAGLANARRFTLFHFSPRYETDNPESAFYAEANAAYEAVIRKEG